QVVEQLGMRRTLACLPEVAWGADDPFAEVPLPDPVGHHTRRQRIGSVSQPLSQFLAPAASYDRGLPVTGQNERKTLWREVPEVFRIAADKHPLFSDLSFRKRAGKRRFRRA